MRLFINKSKIKVGICVDNNLYDLESINESVKEVKVITKPLFFNGFKNFSTIDLIKMGDKGFLILDKIEKYIRWINNGGDPFILEIPNLN